MGFWGFGVLGFWGEGGKVCVYYNVERSESESESTNITANKKINTRSVRHIRRATDNNN